MFPCLNAEFRENLRELWNDVEAFPLLKENLASFIPEWLEALTRIVADQEVYLDQEFQRELSGTNYAMDHDGFGQ